MPVVRPVSPRSCAFAASASGNVPAIVAFSLPDSTLAAEVGFATGASLRQHLHAAIGVSPQAYRRTSQRVR